MRLSYWASGFCAAGALHHIISGNTIFAIVCGFFAISNLIYGIQGE